MIKTSDKKSPWDLTQIEDSEMKDAIKLIKSNGGVEGCRMFAEDVEVYLRLKQTNMKMIRIRRLILK